MTARIREFRDGDLGRVVALCEREGLLPVGTDGLSADELADLLAEDDVDSLVAEREDGIVGVAVGAVHGPVASIYRVVGEAEVGDRLLDELEGRLSERGGRRYRIDLHGASDLQDRLIGRGYELVDGVAALRRRAASRTPTELHELGGQIVDPDLWEQLRGMEQVKDVIERRIILPLAEPELASRHGVAAPQSVVLFGPPGTGKTTFAKGIASRLGWPYVPVEVAQLVGDDRGEPALLAETFDRLLEAPSAVAFVDEVEDLAADRQSERRVSPRVTNEFLRQLPRIRGSFDHLLVCATNAVSDLDPAFLRPGRFDYVVPVGPPDGDARRAIWQRYVEEITDEEVDLDALVDASDRFTPADIEFAARKAAQFAFEQEYDGDRGHRATTGEFLEAISQTRPTVTDEMLETFEADVERFARY